MKTIKYATITLIAATTMSLLFGCGKPSYDYDDVNIGMKEEVLVEMFPEHKVYGESDHNTTKIISWHIKDDYCEATINDGIVISKVRY